MTVKEFRSKLESLKHEAMDDFRSKFGGGEGSIEHYVREFSKHPEWEERLCELLGTETETEKHNRLQLESVDASKREAGAAEEAAVSAAEANRIAVAANQLSAQANTHANDANKLAQHAIDKAGTSNLLSLIALLIAVAAFLVALLEFVKN